MEEIKCSFCGTPKSETLVMVTSMVNNNIRICDKCIERADDILEEQLIFEETLEEENFIINIKKPKEIKEYLDNYVIGQEQAKKTVAVAVYNHYKRLLNSKGLEDNEDTVEIDKSNLVLLGNTGTGKTLIAKTISKLLNVPFTIVDATVFTEAGYVGEDVESILSRLLQVADYDVEKAEKGIVFIDEIDKVARKSDNASLTRDVSGEGVQQSMLKLLEGAIVKVPPKGGRKHPDQEMVEVNTKNILFIAGGAFDGIEKIISSRINTKPLGYASTKDNEKLEEKNILSYVTHQDLKKFGLIPELIGRFPVITNLNPLDKETLIRIISEPKNAILKQYKELFKIDGIDLSIDKKALEFIVEKALDYKLGARGLRSICEEILTDIMYELPKVEKFKLTKKIAEEKLKRV